MEVIDSHVHLYPPEVNRDPAAWALEKGEPHWATLCTRRRKDGRPVQGFPSVDELLRAMDCAGIARAVLLGWYWQKPENCVAQNRFYARCVQAHGDRLSACATVHAGAGDAAVRGEIRRSRDEGLVGLGELSPHSQGYPIHDPAFEAALEVAEELGWPVNLHVTDPEGSSHPGKVSTPPEDFAHLANRFPRVQLILAHWGGRLPLREGFIQPDNVHYDTAASPLLYPGAGWRQLLQQIPADRLIYGSDHPLNNFPRLDPEANLGRFADEMRNSGLAGADLEKIFHGNARILFRLPSAGAPTRSPGSGDCW